MEFFKVSSEGLFTNIKVIAASDKYQAIGYFVMETQKEGIELEEISARQMKRDEKIEVECIGFPVYKTVEELFKEQTCLYIPWIVTGLEN
ncbi:MULTISPECIES: hypothetical protein [Bacillus]|uniref:hypothetical protein n=1 Tax=Bacillus TaxID=1386 RepID=UPI00094C2CE5|nr:MULTISPECIES: hypothetical protein [Bacillus]MEC0902802.1 hypothetical protein [Bacillus anthracis]